MSWAVSSMGAVWAASSARPSRRWVVPPSRAVTTAQDGVRQRLSSIVHYLTPKQEGRKLGPGPAAQRAAPGPQLHAAKRAVSRHGRVCVPPALPPLHDATGDVGDVLMISISLAVFVWLAMQMYR